MTARWVVDEVMAERDLAIVWQPISLLEKNQPEPGSEYYAASLQTHRYLRVMEAIRAATESEGRRAVSVLDENGDIDDPLFRFYWELCRRIHHDRDLVFDPASVLAAVDLDPDLAAAADEERWDAEILRRMGEGLDLTGTDVGTPLIAFEDDAGAKVGLFGPVITRVPSREDSLRLWDGFVSLATVPGFWELKRTRTERPEFGERP